MGLFKFSNFFIYIYKKNVTTTKIQILIVKNNPFEVQVFLKAIRFYTRL